MAGPNRLMAYAFNKDNVKSKDANLLLTGAESLKRAGTAWVIAVGVNEYANYASRSMASMPVILLAQGLCMLEPSGHFLVKSPLGLAG